jgi:hypothetical protein
MAAVSTVFHFAPGHDLDHPARTAARAAFLPGMNRTRGAVLAAAAAGVAVLAVLNFALIGDSSPHRAAARCGAGDLGCYETRYAQLVDDAGPERAMRVFRADYARDPVVRARCHSLAHVIGHAAGERYRSVAEAYRHGDRFCASGYYHGAMEAIVAGPERSRALARPNGICASLRRHSTDEGNCAHGLGHGFMAVRANDVPKSLGLCDRLSAGYERRNCYDGVFMQNVMAQDDPRHPTRYLDPQRPLRLCSLLPGRYSLSCLKRQVLYALEVTRGDFRTIFALCRRVGAGGRPECERQLGEAAADLNISSQPDVTVQAGGTAQICGLAADAAGRRRCVEGAAGWFVFHYDRTAEAATFCQAVGPLRGECSAAVRRAAAREPLS